MVQDIVSFTLLEGLPIARTTFSSEQIVAASCVLPILSGLMNNFFQSLLAGNAALETFKPTVFLDLSKRFLKILD